MKVGGRSTEDFLWISYGPYPTVPWLWWRKSSFGLPSSTMWFFDSYEFDRRYFRYELLVRRLNARNPERWHTSYYDMRLPSIATLDLGLKPFEYYLTSTTSSRPTFLHHPLHLAISRMYATLHELEVTPPQSVLYISILLFLLLCSSSPHYWVIC